MIVAEVREASVEFLHQPFVQPLVISSGAITEITEARATVRVRLGAREAVGVGSIYLSDLWAWPDPNLSHRERDGILRRLCTDLARQLPQCTGDPAHPLELGMRLHEAVLGLPIDGGAPTALARAMCASPFDAAIHDAAGRALGLCAMDFYEDPVQAPSVDGLFSKGNAGEAIARLLRQEPIRTFDAWLVVGDRDDFERDVAPWVRGRRYRAIKLKIHGRDPEADARRTVEVHDAVRAMAGGAHIRLTADSNGATPGPDAAVEYLERVRALDSAAYNALEYIEQPTGRDITAEAHDWRAVAALKPVLLDEGLTDTHALSLAEEQGWSGFALKTCKGHSFALVSAAWAAERGMSVALQDLTNPGLSAIHAALFAAFVPTINGVELNAAQFTPAANAEWLPRLAGLLAPEDGTHRLPVDIPAGLGGSL